MWIRCLAVFPLAWLLATNANADLMLAVDIGVADTPVTGSTPNDLESGFQRLDGAHQFAGGSGDQNNLGVLPLSGTFGSLEVTLQAPGVNGALIIDSLPELDLPFGNLGEEAFIAFRTDTILDIDGLGAGEYQMTTWHHWTTPSSSVRSMDIVVSDQTGSGATTVASNVQWSSQTSGPITSANFGFTIAPNEDLRVRFESVGGATTVVNGFSLSRIPEPSSMALLASAIPFTLLRQRKRRR